MNAINQNNNNHNNGVLCNTDIINKFSTNINNKDNPELVRGFLQEMIDEDIHYFVLVDGRIAVLHYSYRNPMFQPIAGKHLVWLDVDDLMRCNVLVRGEDVHAYMEDDDAEFGLEILVGNTDDDGYPELQIRFENRETEEFDHVFPVSGDEYFELRIEPAFLNKLVDIVEQNIEENPWCVSELKFSYRNVRFSFFRRCQHSNGVVFYRVKNEEDTKNGCFTIDAVKQLSEDKFGNRLDQDGEIIVEDDE